MIAPDFSPTDPRVVELAAFSAVLQAVTSHSVAERLAAAEARARKLGLLVDGDGGILLAVAVDLAGLTLPTEPEALFRLAGVKAHRVH